MTILKTAARVLRLAAFVAGVAGALPAVAQTSAAALPFTLKAIGPGVYAAIDGPKGESGSNAGFVIGDDGVVVIDTFEDPKAAQALLGEIRRLTPKQVRFVVNTHYHIDHVAGDGVFRGAGANIIAHRNERGWVRTLNAHLFGGRITPAQTAAIAALALPDLTTDHDLTLWLGDRRVDVRVVHGHTGGDLAVAVPDAKVLFCGDLLWRRVSPNIIDGVVKDWIATESDFQALPDAAAWTFVPGHGELANVRDVADFQGYLEDLTVLTRAGRAAGMSGAGLVADVLPKMKSKYGDWAAFGYFAPLEIGFMDAELAGTKTIPVPAAD
jgi:glyoxylase-like metal-dependent hydrolase (beta-lactamase superfamily II)